MESTQENQDNFGTDKTDSQQNDFWADKLESSNRELRSLLSKQVVVL